MTITRFSVSVACRIGLIFVPMVLIPAEFDGLHGIQTAQACSFMISAVPAVFMAVRFFTKLQEGEE